MSEGTKCKTWESIVVEQSWDQNLQIKYLMQFINSQKLDKKTNAYLKFHLVFKIMKLPFLLDFIENLGLSHELGCYAEKIASEY